MEQTHRAVVQVMGMPVSLAIRGRHADDADGRAAWAAVVDELHWVDRVFSTYRPDSWISRLGRGEVSVADGPPQVAEVLALGEAARQASHGAFDVWRTAGDGTPLLDTDGVVKGWAVERAARYLAGLPDTDWCLSAGGDMTCRVARAEAPPWRIGIEDPRDPTRVLAVVPVRDGAVATSGATHRGAHVVDARTGTAPSSLASVTVLAASLVDADLDATCAFALDDDALLWLRGRSGRSGLVVRFDGVATTFVGS